MEAHVITVHYHHAWLIWVLFLAGELFHAALQIDNLSRAGATTRLAVLRQVVTPLISRAFVCAMIFGLIWEDPQLIAQIAKLLGHPLGADEAGVFALPMNNMVAGLYGMFLDSLLGYIPILKSQLPAIETKAAAVK
jgi:hypothetical protein